MHFCFFFVGNNEVEKAAPYRPYGLSTCGGREAKGKVALSWHRLVKKNKKV